jgi:hypothetical protein
VGRRYLLALVFLLAAGAAGAAPPPLTVRPTIEFGYVKSLSRDGAGYRLRLDLALRLTGRTAIAACIDNDHCRRDTRGFPDDVYYRDLHYVLTYRVPADARVTVLASNPTRSVRITTRELYDLAHGRNPRRRRLEDARLRHLGFYVEVVPSGSWTRFDAAIRLEQVFQP